MLEMKQKFLPYKYSKSKFISTHHRQLLDHIWVSFLCKANCKNFFPHVREPTKEPVLRIRIRDPVPVLTPGSGMGKKSGSGSGMNIPDHISESLETIVWVKILQFFDADADPGIFLTLDPG
jgi:hypothetical protein